MTWSSPPAGHSGAASPADVAAVAAFGSLFRCGSAVHFLVHSRRRAGCRRSRQRTRDPSRPRRCGRGGARGALGHHGPRRRSSARRQLFLRRLLVVRRSSQATRRGSGDRQNGCANAPDEPDDEKAAHRYPSRRRLLREEPRGTFSRHSKLGGRTLCSAAPRSRRLWPTEGQRRAIPNTLSTPRNQTGVPTQARVPQARSA
jgi:hypothetical protein